MLAHSRVLRNEVFLSTPSARRATHFTGGVLIIDIISIHALREEGDRSEILKTKAFIISIHALREEGDVQRGAVVNFGCGFLSTPSARRAT